MGVVHMGSDEVAVAPPEPPWLALPPDVSDLLRPLNANLVEAIIEAVPQLVPAYARPIEGSFGR
ncbi:hypothetical protein [Arthrobacter bussei]|uniref:hypothetical protein n=1 Tax=Arthrobacter bussei TaxID=2594179 RepID=UPI0030CA26D6